MRHLLLPAVPYVLDACMLDQDGCASIPLHGSQLMQIGLNSLHDLKEALHDMESMVMHNQFIDELLLYRGMKGVSDMLGGWTLRTQSTCAVAQKVSDDGMDASSFGFCRTIACVFAY